MDFNSLKDVVSGISLYDVKAGVRKVQNAMMNYTEMEAKVREATNNEPWGASSTLMQDIANGTYSYQHLNEIMPMIYKRFTEKAAEEWRQIYKALQLLEFLIKNGSERVIDDARSHAPLLKMLRQFHYIDPNGKDQGINVRNRAKELTDLLADSDRIRAERKKSKQTRNKYGGVEGGSSLGGGFSSGAGSSSRYGGFGSETGGYGGYSGGVFGDGGGFGGEDREAHTDLGSGGGSSFRRKDQYEEYDEFDDGAAQSKASSAARRTTTAKTTAPPKAEPPKQKVADLFSFDDEPVTSSAPVGLSSPPVPQKAPAALEDDDDFDDFQSAAPAAPQAAPARLPTDLGALNFASPQPVSAPQAANLSGLVALNSISPHPQQQNSAAASAFAAPAQPMQQPMAPFGGAANYQAAQPNYYTSVPTAAAAQANTAFGSPAIGSTTTSTTTGSAAKPTGSAFGSLWNQASTGEKKAATPTSGPKLSSLAKEKASAGIWGTPAAGAGAAPAQKPAGGQTLGNGLDDLLG